MSETQPPPPGPEPWEPTWDPDTGPQPSQSGPRSHRAPLKPNQVLAPLASVAVVIIVVLLLVWINGRPPGGTSSTAVAGATAPTTPALVTATKSPSPHSSTSVTSPPSHAPSSPPKPATKPKRSKSPAAHPSKSTQPPPASRTAMATVQVLNNSRITGLAHQVAAEVANRGWQLGVIGNMQGALPVTTVFYAPGEEPAAVHLAHEFASIQRIEPNAAAHLTAKGITLVLTRDWVS